MRTKNRLPDSIPVDCIGLADAFQRFVQKVYPRIDNLTAGEATFEKAKAAEEELGKAEAEFRQMLSEEKICAMFEGVDGVRRCTSPNHWVGGPDYENALQGFWSNYVDGPSRRVLIPGPDTRTGLDKHRAPIFFERQAFERWLETKRAKGRVSGDAEKQLPRQIEGYYSEHPGATRTQVWKALQDQLGCFIPRKAFRNAIKDIPAQGRPGVKGKA
jgi:hypothetical protein